MSDTSIPIRSFMAPFKRRGSSRSGGQNVSVDHRAPTPLSQSPVLSTHRHRNVWDVGRETLNILNFEFLKKGGKSGI